jgi:hypothetical protein
MSLEITEELIARQTPEAQAIIRALLATIRQLQEQLNQSPRNSSLPPRTEHPPRQSDPTQVPGGPPSGWSARPHQAGASASPFGTV